MGGNITAFLEIKIVDLIPDAFFIALDNDPFHPMRTAIEDAITAFSIDERILLCIRERNGDLSHLSFFRDVEGWLLILDLHGLDPPGVDIAIIDLVPGAIKRVAQLTIFIDGDYIYN